MWNWIKKVWSAVTGGAEKVGGAAAAVAGNKTVDAIALAAGQAALATMSPQAQAVASAALALAPTVHQLVQQVQATHDAVQLAAKALPGAVNAAAEAATPLAVQAALGAALQDHAAAVTQLQQVSSALNTVVGVAQAVQAAQAAPKAA